MVGHRFSFPYLVLGNSRVRPFYHCADARTIAKILDSDCIRLSPYSEMNDPRESKSWQVRVEPPPDTSPLNVDLFDRVFKPKTKPAGDSE